LSRREQNQRYYQKNKERIKAKDAKWREENPERWAYLMHKQHSKERGIDFQFDYDDWIKWWGDDFDNRGTHDGQIVMARYEDSGPYHPDNVFKATGAENTREHWDRYRANPS
jgi:hypothetical protein